jgi:choice-of-anchor A domain-containing protein/uncharacterized repeat protein (TIGR01451 family)
VGLSRKRLRPARSDRQGALLLGLLTTALVVALASSTTQAAASRHAAASACDAGVLGNAQGFNVFVRSDYSASNTDVKGRAAAGGNVSVASYAVGVDLPPDPSRVDLIAGGSLTVGGGGAQAPNGSVTYAGTLTGTITTPHGTLGLAAPPFQMSDEFTALAAQSKAIGGLAANGTAGGPSYAYELVGTSATTNVFTIPASALQTAQVIKIKVPAGSSAVVNVTGSSYSSAAFPTAAIQFWDGSQYVQLSDPTPPALEALRTNLLWNFPDATSVQIGPNLAWEGTVLAPLAAVTFPGSTQLNGTLIAATLVDSQGSARNHPYTGCIPVAPPTPVLQAVNDRYAIQQPNSLTVAAPGVLANDVVPPGAAAAVELVGGAAHGTVSAAADGGFRYTPAKGYAGSDTFTYRLRQASSTSNVATVTVDVTPRQAKLVTFVARVCPSYDDVTANLARNDIQESLRPLGADSVYESGRPIDPDIEAANQAACKPLPDWQLTLGTGIEQRAVSGPWGSLSIVTDPFATPIVTLAETDLLNDRGEPTGRSIAGATTIALDDAQADLAAQPSALWTQGGTPSDPILDQTYPGRYAFAALRCAVDNLNGDNVEWIAFPAGATHVFCYAYYVRPPPTSGTIVVRKVVTAPENATQTFGFTGNLTFDADRRFELSVVDGAPAAATFYRAETLPGDAPWDVAEDVPPAWFLTGLECTSATGTSKTSTDLATGKAVVTLAPGDTVTCTFTDSQTPPSGALAISKTTSGGIGTFGYTVAPAGGGASVTATATTTSPGVEVAARPESIPLAPGRYTIRETLPTSRLGTWRLTAVVCNGADLPATNPVTVTVAAGAGLACAFENRFRPYGSITILKKAWGGVGTAGFTIYAQSPSKLQYDKTAKVVKEGVAVLARGDPTNALPLGTYRIQEFAVEGTDPTGWALTSVLCNGKLVGSSQGAITVTLTRSVPRLRCLFTNTHTAAPVTPEPGPQPKPDPDPVPTTDLRVSKTADRSQVEVGDVITYTIKVHNAGEAAAHDVVLPERTPITNATVVSATLSQGVCTTKHVPAACYLGTIEPGQTVTILVRLRATKVGPLPNSVTVNSATVIVPPPTSGVEGEVVAKKRPKPQKPQHTSPPLTG